MELLRSHAGMTTWPFVVNQTESVFVIVLTDKNLTCVTDVRQYIKRRIFQSEAELRVQRSSS